MKLTILNTHGVHPLSAEKESKIWNFNTIKNRTNLELTLMRWHMQFLQVAMRKGYEPPNNGKCQPGEEEA